jgi:AAA15 family ATPase/GTPase
MIASSDKAHLDTHTFEVPNSKLRALPSAVIYGANASGKSNILLAMEAMGEIIKTNANRGEQYKLVQPFIFDADSRVLPSEFEVTFQFQGIRYDYGFSTTKDRIYEEWLLAYPKGQQIWFERHYNREKKEYKWTLGENLVGHKKIWQDATRENALFLSTAVSLNSIQLNPIFDYLYFKLLFLNDHNISDSDDDSYIGENTINLVQSEAITENELTDLLQVADIGIEKFKLDGFAVNKDIQKGEWVIPVLTPKFQHSSDPTCLLELAEESRGTQRLFDLGGVLLHGLKRGKIFFIDELESSLHPTLLRYIVGLFNDPKTNPNHAQLIFTTHDTTILDEEVFRRDQIWFTEKNDSQETLLFSLADFKSKKEDIGQSYLDGRYGAVPFIGRYETLYGKMNGVKDHGTEKDS